MISTQTVRQRKHETKCKRAGYENAKKQARQEEESKNIILSKRILERNRVQMTQVDHQGCY